MRCMQSESAIRRYLMDAAIIVVDSDASTTTAIIVRSMALLSAPVIDVAVCYLLIDGSRLTLLPGGRLAVVTACGAPDGRERLHVMFLCHAGVVGTAGYAPIRPGQILIFPGVL